MPSMFSSHESIKNSVFTTFNPIFFDPALVSQASEQKSDHGGCFDDQKWFLIIGSSLVVIFFSLFVVLTCKVWFMCFGKNDPNKEENISWLSEAKDWSGQLISAQSTVGQLLVVLVFLFSIFSLIIYLIDTESGCKGWLSERTQQADLAFNIFFLVYFLIRFAASSEKLLFLFEMYSIVDFLTIPPSFVLFYFKTNWLGLRFARALRLMSIPDVLQYLNLLKTSTSIRLCQLTSTFLSVWLTAAGMVHLVENSGDPFREGLKVKSKSYWECIYFTLVTMSTVGYGDVCCETSLGRLFMVFFILGALAMFASFIPEMMEMFANRSKYNGEYISLPGKRHVVLCGHITHDSVSSFLADFLHQDRLHAGVQVVLLHRKEPDLELGGVLKRQMTQVHFFKGSVMNSADLSRVKVKKADACMILANKYSRDPDAEDASNIMRVVSVKNSCAQVRVLVQLMQYHNKAHLLNVASWDIRRGDEVICIAELKLASIGQSCMAPGFSTLLANLFTMRSYKPFGEKRELWQELYMRGTSMEMYTSFFSIALHSLTFPQAALVCFEKLGLLLIGVESGGVRINPSGEVFIRPDTQGFFVAESAEDVKRVLFYCMACHGRDPDISTIKRCPCHIEHRKKGVLAESSTRFKLSNFAKLPFLQFKRRQISGIQSKIVSYDLETPGSFYEYQQGFDLNLTHHHRMQLPPQYKQIVKKDYHSDVPYNDNIRECFIKQRGSTMHELKLFPNQYTYHNRQCYNDVCSHAREESFQVYGQKNETQHNCTHNFRKRSVQELSEELSYDYTGMFYWTSPQPFNACLMTKEEASKKTFEDHVVVCVFAGQRSAEVGLRSLVMPLRASNLQRLRDVVLVGDSMFVRKEWSSLCNFPRIFMLEGSPLDRATLRTVNVDKCSMCVIIASRNMHEDDLNLVDKEVILCSLNIKAMSFQMNTCSEGSKSGHDIPMITELGNDTNVQFLDQDDDDDPNTELYMTQPFACGTAFAVSVLDSLMSTTFFNANALTLIRTLITGGDTAPLERILAEGVGMTGGHLVPHMNRSRVTQIAVWHKPFYEIYQRNIAYSYLFSQAMQCHGILCIGLYRLKDAKGGGKRYVITNPPGHFPLLLSDKVFCLRPFESED